MAESPYKGPTPGGTAGYKGTGVSPASRYIPPAPPAPRPPVAADYPAMSISDVVGPGLNIQVEGQDSTFGKDVTTEIKRAPARERVSVGIPQSGPWYTIEKQIPGTTGVDYLSGSGISHSAQDTSFVKAGLDYLSGAGISKARQAAWERLQPYKINTGAPMGKGEVLLVDIDKAIKAGLYYDVATIYGRDFAEAAQELAPYTNSDGVDIARYLRDNPNKKNVLVTAGYDSSVIKEAEDFNAVPMSVDAFIQQYAGDKPPSEEDLKAMYQGQQITITEGYPPVEKKVDAFEYFSTSGPGGMPDYIAFTKWYKKAEEAYKEKYGTGTFLQSKGATIGEFIVAPALKAVQPGGSIQDVSKVDWVITVVIVASTVVPAVRGVAAGVRMGLTTIRAIRKVALAEVFAPVTMATAPIKSAKGTLKQAGDIAETVVRPSKIPLEDITLRYMTVRVPVKKLVKAGLTGEEAKALRSMATAMVIKNNKVVSKIDDAQLVLTKSALNKTSPAAIHTTPDVTPFMQGAEVSVKYKPGTKTPVSQSEQGLFVSPTMHERFTESSAFGLAADAPNPGALIIRDPAILNKMEATRKIFRGTTEIEMKLPVGTKLSAPSQVLFTRNMQGEKLALLVFGKPFSPLEIAKLKLLGPYETIKQIFSGTYKVSKVNKKLVDAVAEEEKKLQALKAKVKKVKGKAEEDNLKRKIAAQEARLDRARRDLSELYQPGRLRPIIVSRSEESLIRRPSVREAAEAERGLMAYRDYSQQEASREIKRIEEKSPTRRTVVPVPEIRTPTFRTTEEEDRITEIPTRKVSTITRVPPLDEERTDEEPPPDRESRIRPPPDDSWSRPPPEEPPDEYPPIKLKLIETKEGKKKYKLPPGSIAWKQGMFWKFIPPPWTQQKPITLKYPPVGARTGGRTPQQTVQMIGEPKARVPRTVSIDMGVVDILIEEYGKKITFTGGGLKTSVGQNLPGATRGMSIDGGKLVLPASYQPKKRIIRKVKRPTKRTWIEPEAHSIS